MADDPRHASYDELGIPFQVPAGEQVFIMCTVAVLFGAPVGMMAGSIIAASVGATGFGIFGGICAGAFVTYAVGSVLILKADDRRARRELAFRRLQHKDAG